MARLLDVLREDCHLTGTKEGCGEGECGACTVIVDGRAVNACLVPIAQVRGAKVTTIEGLKGRHPLQRAFAEQGGAQCGICTPGMVMAAIALGPNPTLAEVRTGLAGNLCRCTGYMGIYRAIKAAGRRLPKRPLEPSRKRQSAKRAARARTVDANSATVRPATRPGKARFAGPSTSSGPPRAASRGGSRERGREGTVVAQTRGTAKGAGRKK